VRVEIADRSVAATAGSDGKWQVWIQRPAIGGPYTIEINGMQSAELQDVLVGDVWICAGQSNKQFGRGERFSDA